MPINLIVPLALLWLGTSGCGGGTTPSNTRSVSQVNGESSSDKEAVTSTLKTELKGGSINDDKPSTTGDEKVKTEKTPEQIAIDAARLHVKGVNIPVDTVVTVKKENDVFIVTFEYPKKDPPVPGPDYYAKVRVDAKTGKVLGGLGAP